VTDYITVYLQSFTLHNRTHVKELKQKQAVLTENENEDLFKLTSFILNFCFASNMQQQYQDLNLNSFKMCHCTACFNLFGHHHVHKIRWELL
jgi:hypothetical protein